MLDKKTIVIIVILLISLIGFLFYFTQINFISEGMPELPDSIEESKEQGSFVAEIEFSKPYLNTNPKKYKIESGWISNPTKVGFYKDTYEVDERDYTLYIKLNDYEDMCGEGSKYYLNMVVDTLKPIEVSGGHFSGSKCRFLISNVIYKYVFSNIKEKGNFKLILINEENNFKVDSLIAKLKL